MKEPYTRYFQKSTVFLYPNLKVKKGVLHVPKDTYVAWDKIYSKEDLRFICVYKHEKDYNFINFLNRNILNNKFYEKMVHIDNNTHVVIFNFSEEKENYNHFIKGQYSKLSYDFKRNIIDFFDSTELGTNVKAFLYPDEFHDVYADYFNIDINLMKEVNEICSIPDIDKETLKLDIPESYTPLFKSLKSNINE